MSLFKKTSRADELEECINGITSVLSRGELAPDELMYIFEKLKVNLIAHLEQTKSRQLIDSKILNYEYKTTSAVLAAFKNVLPNE